MRETFKKSERLYLKDPIDLLFRSGTRIQDPPVRITWLFAESHDEMPVRILVIVPKAFIPGAADRNLIKRRMREVYRRNKAILTEGIGFENRTLHMAITYQSREILSFEETRGKIIVLLQRLNETIKKVSG